jgi:hypothetical protein
LPHTLSLTGRFLKGFLLSDCSVGKFDGQVGKFESQVGKNGLQVGKFAFQVGIEIFLNLESRVSLTERLLVVAKSSNINSSVLVVKAHLKRLPIASGSL